MTMEEFRIGVSTSYSAYTKQPQASNNLSVIKMSQSVFTKYSDPSSFVQAHVVKWQYVLWNNLYV